MRVKIAKIKKQHLIYTAVALSLTILFFSVITIFFFVYAKLDNLALIRITETPTPSLTPTATATLTPTPTPNDNNFNLDYDYPIVEQKANTVRIPVMVYHHISALTGKASTDAYVVTPDTFDKQMAYLKAKNYKTITPKEFYDQLKSGKNPTQKEVLLTFDDGNKDNYLNAFPILKKYGFTGTFYVVVNKTGITKAQLKEMSDAGMVIDSHTMTHPDLSKITDTDKLKFEIGNSKSILQGYTGKTIYSIAYPGCVSNSASRSQVSKSGYLLGFSCEKKIDHKFSNRLSLSRMHVYSDLENFKKRLSGIWEISNDYK